MAERSSDCPQCGDALNIVEGSIACESCDYAKDLRLLLTADTLAQAVRGLLAGTPYRHSAPTVHELSALARALGAHEAQERRCGYG